MTMKGQIQGHSLMLPLSRSSYSSKAWQRYDFMGGRDSRVPGFFLVLNYYIGHCYVCFAILYNDIKLSWYIQVLRPDQKHYDESRLYVIPAVVVIFAFFSNIPF